MSLPPSTSPSHAGTLSQIQTSSSPPEESLHWSEEEGGDVEPEKEEKEEEEEEMLINGAEMLIKGEEWVIVIGEERGPGGLTQGLAAGKMIERFSLERTSTLGRSLLLLMFYLGMEIGKQLSNFTLAKRNGSQYPLPSTVLVLLVESGKLCTILLVAQVNGLSLRSSRPSLVYVIPAVCYFTTNIMYLYGLTMTSPPIWILLIQSRTLYTAAAYKLIFKREINRVQWAGCCLVVISIAMVRGSQVENGIIPPSVLLLSQLAALLSTAASLIMELLLKNDKRPYLEQQMWLYVFGITVGALYFIQPGSVAEVAKRIGELMQPEQFTSVATLFLAVAFSATTGLCVPLIVKRLDSIVKDYLAALNNLLLSMVTAVLFPEEFTLSIMFIFSLSTLLLGISLYERKILCKT